MGDFVRRGGSESFSAVPEMMRRSVCGSTGWRTRLRRRYLSSVLSIQMFSLPNHPHAGVLDIFARIRTHDAATHGQLREIEQPQRALHANCLVDLLKEFPPRSTDGIHCDKDFSEAVANQVAAYTKMFEAQVEVTQAWPEKFHFPEPSNDIEREAMRFLSTRSSER